MNKIEVGHYVIILPEFIVEFEDGASFRWIDKDNGIFEYNEEEDRDDGRLISSWEKYQVGKPYRVAKKVNNSIIFEGYPPNAKWPEELAYQSYRWIALATPVDIAKYRLRELNLQKETEE